MKIIEQYINELKKLPLREEQEIHSFLDDFFYNINEVYDSVCDDDIFTLIHDFRVVFFKYMTDGEKEKLVSLICRYLKKRGEMTPQIIEYCGLIYKYTPPQCQKDLFDLIFLNYGEYCKTNRGTVAVTTFIKYTNRCYTEEQKAFCQSALTELNAQCNEDIKDTLAYTLRNMHTCFVPAKKKVLLLIPEFLSGSSFLQPPLCFMRTKMQLEKLGIHSDIFDNRIFNYSIDQVLDLVGRNYQYIVVTSTPLDQAQNFFIDHRFVVFAKTCNKIKEAGLCDKLITVGSHGTVDHKMLTNDVDPDMIVQGEYDDLLYRAILSYENNTLESLPYEFIYKEQGTWHRGSSNSHGSDWNDYPLDFSVIDLGNYFGYRYIKNTHVKQQRWAVLQASRGCPYECTFCYNLYGRKVRFKDVEHIVSECKQLKALSCNEIFFIDQTFTLNKEYVRCLCKRLIEENILIPWQCETRIDLLDKETVSLMKQAACTAVWLGIESFDEDVIKVCKKGYNIKQLQQSFSILKEAGMEYHAFIMVGMEGESRKSVEGTIDIIERDKIKLSKSIIQCTPRPGTEYYTHLPAEIKDSISYFWQIDALRGYSQSDITDAFINKMVQRLLKISNEN